MEAFRKAVLTTYPGKAIWVFVTILYNAIRFPILMIYWIPTQNRPHPKWSWRQALRLNIIKTYLWNMAWVEGKTPLSLIPGGERERFVAIDTAKKSYYADLALSDPKIIPTRLGATWYPGVPKSEKPAYVCLHFHGGAFAIGDGRSADAGYAAKVILHETPVSYVFAPQYRLSSNKDGRFPAQLQDAITAYTHLLVHHKIPPSNIIFSGDSAGGNLCLALLRYIADSGKATGLPAPGCAWLWSPWVEPNSAYVNPNIVYESPNYHSDYIPNNFGKWGADGLLPSADSGITLEHPYISPLGHGFKTETPLWIQVGECEILFHDVVRHQEEMKEAGNKVDFSIAPLAPHDIILIGHILAFDKEARAEARKAAAFLKSLQPLKLS